MKRQNKKLIRALTRAAAVAALYTALTMLSALFGLSGGALQLRLSEGLCVLAFIFPEAVTGLTVGCALSNLITGANPMDIIFGTLATFIGAYLGRYIFTRLAAPVWLSTLPTLIANMLIIPAVLVFTYGAKDSYLYFLIFVGAGELISATLFGTFLYKTIANKKHSS